MNERTTGTEKNSTGNAPTKKSSSRTKVALRAVFFSQAFRPGLGLCRAYGAGRRKFQIENFRFQMEATAKDKVAGGRPSQLRVSKAVTCGGDLFSAAFSAELDFPRLKPIYEFTSWTEVQLPLLKQGAPTQRQQIRESSVKRSASLAPARRRRYEEQSKATTRTKQRRRLPP